MRPRVKEENGMGTEVVVLMPFVSWLLPNLFVCTVLLYGPLPIPAPYWTLHQTRSLNP